MASTLQRPPLAVDVIEQEEILQHINPALLQVDYNDSQTKTVIVGGSFAFFTLVFASIIFICSLFPTIQNLGLKIKIFLSLSVVRGIYGVFGIIIGAYAIFYSSNLDRDIVFGRTATASVGMLVTAGFFIFELGAVVFSDIAFRTFSKLLIIHHSIGVVSYLVAINLNANFCIGCRALILEMSTPFSCLCYVLLKIGMENSTLWKINQMVLVHTFHLRNVIECYLWYVTYKNWRYIWNFLPTSLFILTYFGLTIVTFLMTPYWGYKKTQQLFNPVDWNFQESRNQISNGSVRKVKDTVKKIS